MVLFSSETNALIRKSNSEWSRTKLSELLVDKDIGIQARCPKTCNKHHHGVIMETNNQKYLYSLSEIVNLPSLQVLKDALEDVKSFEEAESKRGCIFWEGYMCEFFTRADLGILKDILEYSITTRKQLQVEKYALKKKTVCPPGLPNLDGRYKRAIDEAWHKTVEEHDLTFNIDLQEHVTGEELIQIAMAEENRNMYDKKKLNTESVQKMMEPNGFMTADAVEYLCRHLEESNPENRYIYLNQTLTSKQARILNAIEVNVKNAKNVYFIFSRSQTKILDSCGNNPHYALATIREDGSVYYGDGYFELVPSNLKQILNDYYIQKYDKPIKDIQNLSKKRNYPVQEDAHLCGFISLMLVTIMEDEDIFKMLLSKIPLKAVNSRQEFLITAPSDYNLYLRQIFLTAYSESKLSKQLFMSESCLTRISQILKQPTKKFQAQISADKRLVRNKTPMNTKEPQTNGVPSLVIQENMFKHLAGDSEDEVETGQREQTEKVHTKSPTEISKEDSSSFETNGKNNQSESEKAEEEDDLNQAKPLVNNTIQMKEKDALIASSFLGKIRIQAKKTNIFSDQYNANQDGYNWEKIVKKNKHKRCKKNWYRCLGELNGVRCPAEKSVSSAFGGKARQDKIVEFCVSHLCSDLQSETVTENSAMEEVIHDDKEPLENCSTRIDSKEGDFNTESQENRRNQEDEEAKSEPSADTEKVGETSSGEVEANDSSEFDDSDIPEYLNQSIVKGDKINYDSFDFEVIQDNTEPVENCSTSLKSKEGNSRIESKENKTIIGDMGNCSRGMDDIEGSSSDTITDGTSVKNQNTISEQELSYKSMLDEEARNEPSADKEEVRETSSGQLEANESFEFGDRDIIEDLNQSIVKGDKLNDNSFDFKDKEAEKELTSPNEPAVESTGSSPGMDKQFESPGMDKKSEKVVFFINRCPVKLDLFILDEYSNKYFVKNSCAVVVYGSKRINFDCHRWVGGSGGRGLAQGIYNTRCGGSTSCTFVKKKWTCDQLCSGDRFCCQLELQRKREIQICVYLGIHDHEIIDKQFKDLNAATGTDACDEILEERIEPMDIEKLKEDKEDEISQISSDDSFEEEKNEENVQKMSKFEENMLAKCKIAFPNKETSFVQLGNIVANSKMNYLVKRGKHDQINSAINDGYIYRSNTTRKGFTKILLNQSLPYKYQCLGRKFCRNVDCPVVDRLTVLNSFQNKKSTPNICRFCSYELETEECPGSKFVLRSGENVSNCPNYLIIVYEHDHTCGSPETVLDEAIVEELTELFKTNPELTPSRAYKSLLEKKIREKKGCHEILKVVQCFTFDHKSKNLKASVKRGLNYNASDLSSIKELEKFVTEMTDLQMVMKAATDTYYCEHCNDYKVATSEDEKLTRDCFSCQKDMVNTGPIVLLTSVDQIKTAEQMTKEDGAFLYSTLFLDHQNGRCIDWDTMNTYIYDHQIQSISSIFTAHTKTEDRFSVSICFKLFDELYKKALGTEDSFRPHGFSSDNAGGIIAGLQRHFGQDILFRSCGFHFLFGAFNHCSNAIGSRSSQVRFLRFSVKLLEAATIKKFDLLYSLFKTWIEKSKLRRKKLKPWLNWWVARKTQWATAYTALSLGAVNLAEAGQSKYKKTNGMKRLKLYQSCVYEIGDFLLYSSRLKAMVNSNYIGRGPSKKILNERECKEQMDRIKDQFMTQADLENLYTYLGIKVQSKERKKTIAVVKDKPFLVNDINDLDEALDKFIQDPISPYTYKAKQLKNPLLAKRPGRPSGIKKKRVGRHDSMTSESSLEMSSYDNSSDSEEEVLVRKKKKGGFTLPSSDEDDIGSPQRKSSTKMQFKKRSAQVDFTGTCSKKIRFSDEAMNSDDKDLAEAELLSKTFAEEEEIIDDNQGEKRDKEVFECNICGVETKTVRGIRAHYLETHDWKTYEYSPIMRDSLKNLSNLFTSSESGVYTCSCGYVSPSEKLRGLDNYSALNRQVMLIHRLVDSPHYKYNPRDIKQVFPNGLVIKNGKTLEEDEATKIGKDDMNTNVKCVEPSESYDIVEDQSDDEKYTDDDYEIEDDEDDIEEAERRYKKKDPILQSEKNKVEFFSKRERKNETKKFKALKRQVINSAENYQCGLKCQNDDSHSFEVKNKENGACYTVTFCIQHVICTCPWFKEIERMRHQSANEVCKHVALVTLYCNAILQDNYKGQRFNSNKKTFIKISEMLKSFDPQRNLYTKKKHTNYSLYPPPVASPNTKYPYFTRKEYALKKLSELATPYWFAEKYNRVNMQGDKPSCKYCEAKIDIGTLCLRTDHSYIFQNRNYRKDDFTIKTVAFRVCMEISCVMEINTKIRNKKFKEELGNITNIQQLETISTEHIFDDDRIVCSEMFKNENLLILT